MAAFPTHDDLTLVIVGLTRMSSTRPAAMLRPPYLTHGRHLHKHSVNGSE